MSGQVILKLMTHVQTIIDCHHLLKKNNSEIEKELGGLTGRVNQTVIPCFADIKLMMEKINANIALYRQFEAQVASMQSMLSAEDVEISPEELVLINGMLSNMTAPLAFCQEQNANMEKQIVEYRKYNEVGAAIHQIGDLFKREAFSKDTDAQMAIIEPLIEKAEKLLDEMKETGAIDTSAISAIRSDMKELKREINEAANFWRDYSQRSANEERCRIS